MQHDQEESIDICIVGAGLSGLSAAYEILSKHQRQPLPTVAILEANTRVGGRNLADSDGTDLGSAYIGPTQDRLMRLVDEFGLKLKKVDVTSGKTVQFVRGRSVSYDGIIPPISPLGLLDLNATLVKIDNIVNTVNIEHPHLTPNAEYLDSTTVQEWIRNNCWTQDVQNLIATALNSIIAVEPCEISVLGFAWYTAQSGGIKRILETENGAQDSKVAGGTGQLSIELARRLPNNWLRLGCPVRRIEFLRHNSNNSDAALVYFSSPLTNPPQTQLLRIRAKTVILAIPPSQQHRLDFAGGLHPNRMQALQHFPLKHYMKTFLFYKEPWWRGRGLNGCLVSDSGISVVAYEDSNNADKKTFGIMGFVLAKQAAKWCEGDTTPEQRRDELARHFAKVFQCDEALHPIGYKEKIWAQEPWVGGCAAGVPSPGFLTRFPDEISKAEVSHNVFVAGTEAARVFCGYMDGAIEAGERTARNCLVRLGRLETSQFEVMSKSAPSKQLPYVDMQVSFAERWLVPSVPQAIGLCVVAACLVGGWVLKRFEVL